MRNFELETYFSTWEFKARYHMTASDMESISMSELLAMASKEERDSLDNLWLGYTETWGAPDLREEIAKTYEVMDSSDILCFAGAGEGIYTAMRALLNKDDHAIVIVPNYQSSETIPLEICEVSGVRLHHEDNWKLNIKVLEEAIKENTKLIAMNFPHNPTGTVLGKKELDELIALCKKYELYLFSDEVFRGVEIEEDERMPQIADIYEKGLSLNVMSKAYGLPSLRIGWIASKDSEALLKMERYKHYLSICNSGPSERLAVIALRNKEKILERNRSIVRKQVQELEEFFLEFPTLFEWKRPKGGCIAFPKYIGPDGVEEFCKSLIDESGVLLLPASIYKSELLDTPSDHFRIGFGRIGVFKEGLEVMRKHIQKKYSKFLGQGK